EIKLAALECSWRSWPQVRHVAGVADARALKVRWQKSAAVIDGPAEVRRWIDRDVAGQILIFGAETIQEPGAHGRPGELGQCRAGGELDDRLRMCRRIGMQAADKAQLVHVPGRVRK